MEIHKLYHDLQFVADFECIMFFINCIIVSLLLAALILLLYKKIKYIKK
jgi:hypothetical protein